MRERYALAQGTTALAILSALGIDPKGVRSLTIHIDAGDVITYEVERLALESEIARLCEVLDEQNRKGVHRVDAVAVDGCKVSLPSFAK